MDFLYFFELLEEVGWCWCSGGGLRCGVDCRGVGSGGGGDVADISEDASLSSRGDGGLGDGGARWWARYQLPRV